MPWPFNYRYTPTFGNVTMTSTHDQLCWTDSQPHIANPTHFDAMHCLCFLLGLRHIEVSRR